MATNKNFVVKNGLEVGQDIIVTGNITQAGMSLPASDGQAGQFLKTDGAGNLSFATVISSFNITDGTNTDTVNTGETLTFTAGTGITTTVSDNVVTISGVAQYTDSDAIAAVQGATNLTIDGGTLYVDTSNNYVGIGDTSPQYMLDVGGTTGTGSIAVAGTEVIDSGAEIITAQLKDSGVTAGSYGSASLVPVITVDAKGRITSASTTSVAGVSSFSFNGTSEVLTINTADGGTFTADISALASETYVDTALSNLLDGAPAALDTLNEIAAAINDDADFAGTITSSLATKVSKNGDSISGALSVSGNLTIDTNTLFVDAANNRVGIGTSSGFTGRLRVAAETGNGVFDIKTGSLTANSIRLQSGGSVDNWLEYRGYLGHAWFVDTTERMRIDSSGNLLVGKTSSNAATRGTEFRSSGVNIVATAESTNPCYFNRLTNDGTIINLAKDTSSVGSIGSTSYADAYIAGVSTGIAFGGTNVTPTTNTGAISDNAKNLGGPSARWKDLYLSGIVNASEINLDSSGDVHSSVTTGYVGVAGGTASNSGANAIFYGPANGSNPNKTLFRVGNTVSAAIDSSGNVGIGTSSPDARLDVEDAAWVINEANPLARFHVTASGTQGSGAYASKIVQILADGNYANEINNDAIYGLEIDLGITNVLTKKAVRFVDGGEVGSIEITTSGTTYNTTSDRRLKDNITTITNGKEKLLAMNPVTHTWKADPEADAVHGFVAQEMQQVVPEAVSGDPDGDEMMSMDYGRITPVIVAALQDALKEIEELKTRINELEAK